MADISAPNAAAYGIWGPAYAQALAAQSQGPVAGPLNMLAMRGYMGNEQGGYGEALAATQQAQLAQARMEADAEISKAALGQASGLNQYGGGGMLDWSALGIPTNQAAIDARTADVSNDIAAGIFKDTSAGMANVADTGYLPSTQVMSEQLFPVAAGEEAVELSPYMTPDAQNDRMRAEAAKTSAAAAVTSANRPRGGGGGGGGGAQPKVRWVYDPDTRQWAPTVTMAPGDMSTPELPGVGGPSIPPPADRPLTREEREERARARARERRS